MMESAMPSFIIPLRRGAFAWPSFAGPGAARRLLRRLAALDAAYREIETLRSLDDHMLRDIGVTRADVDDALSLRGAHLRSVLARGRDELEH
jgi:uncharacterized protein YjiS (DUF1127 family)